VQTDGYAMPEEGKPLNAPQWDLAPETEGKVKTDQEVWETQQVRLLLGGSSFHLVIVTKNPSICWVCSLLTNLGISLMVLSPSTVQQTSPLPPNSPTTTFSKTRLISSPTKSLPGWISTI
jgi:hypothetical protein